MSLALDNPTGDAVLFSPADLKDLLEASRKSPRLRMMQPVQRDSSAPVQRLLNAMQPSTYVRPHRHPVEGASETVVILQGHLGVLLFTDEGEIIRAESLRAGCVLDLQPGVWHGMVCLSPDTVIAEFKKGPYNAETDKEFAPWSPEEGEEACFSFLQAWEEKF